MAALAQIFKNEGFEVLGSDTKDKFFTDGILKRAGIKFFEGFSEKNLPKKADLYISSNAYLAGKIKNPEILSLRREKKKIYSYPQALASIFNKKYGLAICGTHGKSTTTSIAGLILERAKLKPTVLVGAEVLNWRSNIYLGRSKFFLIEADEYREAFLNYKPRIIVINSVEYDHPDYFKTRKAYLDSFRKFVSRLPKGGIIISPREVSSKLFGLKRNFPNSFGKFSRETAERKEKILIDVLSKNGRILETFLVAEGKKIGLRQNFDLVSEKAVYRGLQTRAGGIYVFNSALASILALRLGIKIKVIKDSLSRYKGIGRRFEIVKRRKKYILVDDFAHHPTAVRKTIELAKEVFPEEKIIALFQSHTFSRTKKFLKEFAQSLEKADGIIILPIFASAREREGKISAGDIYNLLKGKKKKAYLADSFKEGKEIASKIVSEWPGKSVILLLGAGDIYKMRKML